MKTLFLVTLIAIVTSVANAQDYHEWEIYGGGDYFHTNACALAQQITAIPNTCSVPLSGGQKVSFQQSAYGWHFSLGENKARWFGAVFDFSGDYAKRTLNVGTLSVAGQGSIYPFLFGPRFYLRRNGRVSLFGNPLIGGIHARATLPSASMIKQPICVGCPTLPVSDTKWAYAFGGGVDVQMSEHIAFRAQGDWIRSHFPETLAVDYQNNYRGSAGLVFTFGNGR